MQRLAVGGPVVLLGILVSACYTMRPVTGAVPEVGSVVAFDVNDAGRVALGGSMGPEIAQVEGRLLEKNSDNYLLAVSSLQLLRGGKQVWSGEQVRLKTEHLGAAYERRFSTGRTIGLGVIVVGGFAAFMVTRSLLGGGQSSDTMPADSGNTHIGRF